MPQPYPLLLGDNEFAFTTLRSGTVMLNDGSGTVYRSTDSGLTFANVSAPGAVPHSPVPNKVRPPHGPSYSAAHPYSPRPPRAPAPRRSSSARTSAPRGACAR